MEIIVTIASLVTATTVIITAIHKIYKKIEPVIEQQHALVHGLQGCLRSELERRYRKYSAEGSITSAEYLEWCKDYEAYRALGGNSRGEYWNECIQKLQPEVS